MATVRDEEKIVRNRLTAAIWLLDRIDQLRNGTGHGTIKLDVKNGLVVYVECTERDHLN